MRFTKLTLAAWGHYPPRTEVPFAPGAPDLHVLLGRNEAGKSTLLRAFLASLFGVDRGERTWGSAPGQPVLELEGELADGRLLTVRRAPGSRSPLAIGLAGLPLGEEELTRALGGVTREVWGALFGFDGRQLHAAAEALKGVPLVQAVAGGADPQAVKESLAERADKLYRARGSTQEVNRLAAELAALEQAGRAGVDPTAWRGLKEALAEATRAEKEAEAALLAAEREQDRLGRLAKAHTLLLERDRAAAARAALGEGAAQPLDRAGLEALVSEVEQARRHLAEGRAERARLGEELDGIVLDEGILGAAERLRGLAAARGAREEALRHTKAQREQLARLEAAVVGKVETLLGGDPARLDQLPQDPELPARLTRVGRERDEARAAVARLEEAAAQLAARSRGLAARRAAGEGALDAAPLLAARVDREAARQALTERAQLEQSERAQERVLRRERAALAGLWPEGAPEPVGLPTAAEVDRHEAARRRAEEERAEARRGLEEARRAEAERALEEAGLAAEAPAPSAEALAEARRQRDSAWQGVRGAWLDERRPPLQIAGIAAEFEGLVRGADEVADQRFRFADAVARRERLARERAAAVAERERREARVAELTAALDAEEAAWARRWPAGVRRAGPLAAGAGAGGGAGGGARGEDIVGAAGAGAGVAAGAGAGGAAGGTAADRPGRSEQAPEPAELRELLRRLEAWREARAAAAELAEQRALVESRLGAALERCRAALAESGAPERGGGAGEAAADPEVGARLLDACTRAEDQAREQERQRAALAQEEAQLAEERTRLQQDQERAAERLTRAEAAWEALRRGLPPGEPAELAVWVKGAEQLRRDRAELEHVREQVAEAKRRHEAWEREVAAVLDPLFPAQVGEEAARRVGQAAEALRRAEEDRLRRRALEEDVARRDRRLAEEAQRLGDREAALKARLAEAGADDVEAFRRIAEAAEGRARLDRELASLDAHLATLRGADGRGAAAGVPATAGSGAGASGAGVSGAVAGGGGAAAGVPATAGGGTVAGGGGAAAGGLATTGSGSAASGAGVSGAVAGAAGGAGAEDFDRRARASSAEALAAEAEAVGGQVEQRRVALRDAIGRRIEARQRLDAVDGGGAAAARQQEVELKRAELREAVERWLVYRLAGRVLDRVLAEPRDDREAAVLDATSALFAELTEGRYQGVIPGREPMELHALRADGTTLPTPSLSEGTRHQLYLAARLARALRHNREREPLPLVLDDVLAAFDERRSLAALRVFARVSREAQVLVFTHHQHVVDLAREAEPEVRVQEVGGGA